MVGDSEVISISIRSIVKKQFHVQSQIFAKNVKHVSKITQKLQKHGAAQFSDVPPSLAMQNYP